MENKHRERKKTDRSAALWTIGGIEYHAKNFSFRREQVGWRVKTKGRKNRFGGTSPSGMRDEQEKPARTIPGSPLKR